MADEIVSRGSSHHSGQQVSISFPISSFNIKYEKPGFRARVEFRIEDLWVGLFWKKSHGKFDAWLCLIPCLPIHLIWRKGFVSPSLSGEQEAAIIAEYNKAWIGPGCPGFTCQDFIDAFGGKSESNDAAKESI